ncbi:MAG: MMPL family transporter, partial [Thermodesulfobacteriota bacterium]|nr:MMPL family transporter [Thermodesulfobacteriota bacterium]
MAVYSKVVLKRPWLTLLILAVIFASLGYHIKDFRLDASSDSLILENDKDLKIFKEINKRYGTDDFLLMAYKPEQGELFSRNVLSSLENLRDELKKIKNAVSVVSILDVPLLENPPVPIKDLVTNIKTLGSNDTSLDMARAEFRESPIYQDLLVSSDLSITALQINFKKDDGFEKISSQRSRLREKQNINSITPKEKTELDQLEIKYRQEKIRLDKELHSDIAFIRTLMKNYADKAELFLGGTSMIADDMITFVKNDIKIFGTGMFLFLILTLGVIFKKKRWVFLPIICCIFSIISMTGLIGIFGWEITVISSNFISLQLIVTMALTIHLIVRYRELVVQNPEWSQFDLVKKTIASKFIPCLFTTITTIAGFSSLLVCDILPVINFGWMMSIGMIVSLVVIFLLFPVILILLPMDTKGSKKQFGKKITDLLAHVTEKHAKSIYLVTGLLIIITVTGISKLTVENSFIDYFKKSTQIYQGMKIIDRKMGGTTPLDVIINFQKSGNNTSSQSGNNKSNQSGNNKSSQSENSIKKSEKSFGQSEAPVNNTFSETFIPATSTNKKNDKNAVGNVDESGDVSQDGLVEHGAEAFDSDT